MHDKSFNAFKQLMQPGNYEKQKLMMSVPAVFITEATGNTVFVNMWSVPK